jgi:ATP-dependent Lon protease
MATGMYYTPMGGDIMFVEAIGARRLETAGQGEGGGGRWR